jgi:hypothetical protein
VIKKWFGILWVGLLVFASNRIGADVDRPERAGRFSKGHGESG